MDIALNFYQFFNMPAEDFSTLSTEGFCRGSVYSLLKLEKISSTM